MTAVKSLAIAALLFGGTSLALAQTPPTAGASPPANVTAGPNGAAAYKPTGPSAHAGKHKKMHMSAKSNHHKHMYMSAKGSPHKTLKTGQQQPKQPQ